MPAFKRFMLLVFLTGIAGISYAQQKNIAAQWQFQSALNVGLLEGQVGSAFQLQAIGGARYRSWFAGAGLGLDYYRFRTIPLFLDLRKEFGRSSNKLFVYTDAGTSFSWVTDNEKMQNAMGGRFGNGFYTDFGFGYKIAAGKNNSFLISLGYSFKKLTETYQSPVLYYLQFQPPNGQTQLPNGQTERIDYSLNRLSIKMGWEF